MGHLPQDTGGDATYHLVWADQEAEGMSDHRNIAEITHTRDAGTSLPSRDMQDLFASLEWQVQPLSQQMLNLPF